MPSHRKPSAVPARTGSTSRTRQAPAIEALEGRQLLSASISGSVFNDLSAAGALQRGDPGLANVRVYVDTANTGVYKAGDPTALTDIHGNYTIPGLSGGSKILREVVPAGFRQTLPANGAAQDISLRSESVATNIDFGDTQKVRVSGFVYNDTSKDGYHQSSEAYLGGVTVFIDTNGNGKLDAGEQSTTTNSKGYFVMDDLTPGKSYIVDVNLPAPRSVGAYAGWIKTQPFNQEYRKTLADGQSFDNLAFGIHAPANFVYNLAYRSGAVQAGSYPTGFNTYAYGQYSNSAATSDTAVRGEAYTKLNSNISTGGVSATGSLYSTSNNHSDFASSVVEAQFTVAAATVYHLNYAITGAGFSFYLENLNTNSYVIGPNAADPSNIKSSYSLSQGGTLAPGEYELYFINGASSLGKLNTSAFSLNFSI